MKISRPQDKEPTLQEVRELEKLKKIIDRVTADGKLMGTEFERIKAAIRADKKVTYEELELVRTLIYDKIDNGELEKIWD